MPDGTDDCLNCSEVDTSIIPQHLIQKTYSRLKSQHAPGLCQRWVEDTEPSKRVFDDLAITAFLIELWRMLYGVVPDAENDGERKNIRTVNDGGNGGCDNFPGFVDVACGNGVLVYVLLMEGYRGWGFDARRRKTWGIFPLSVQECLKEYFYVPKPFASVIAGYSLPDHGIEVYTGTFPKGTFIISNHADELTVWTPLMAALACPESPLPFFLIPCCSHSLSGARFRYPPPMIYSPNAENLKSKDTDAGKEEGQLGNDYFDSDQTQQLEKGDLKALRARRFASQTSGTLANVVGSNFFSTMYGSLAAKTMSIAGEIGYEVDKSLLGISSTRNMGILGARRLSRERTGQRNRTPQTWASTNDGNDSTRSDIIIRGIKDVVSRECAREGGIENAARIWIERAKDTSMHRVSEKGFH